MAGPPDDVIVGRLVGGDLDGMEIELEPGQEVVRVGPPLIAFGSPQSRIDEINRTVWEYRFARVDESGAEPEAIYEFHAPHLERPS